MTMIVLLVVVVAKILYLSNAHATVTMAGSAENLTQSQLSTADC